jgi:hypothetical protein
MSLICRRFAIDAAAPRRCAAVPRRRRPARSALPRRYAAAWM